MYKIAVVIAFTFIACRSIRVFTKSDLVDFANTGTISIKDKLRWGGYFNNIYLSKKFQNEAEIHGLAFLKLSAKEAKSVQIQVPIFFFMNGVCSANDPIIDVKLLKDEYSAQEIYKFKSGFGIYTINRDTITLLRYRYMQNRFRLPRWEDKLIKYQGIILNDSTIVNWRQVPPYPNYEWDQIDTIPQTLMFHPFEEKNLIDSAKIYRLLIEE